MKLTLHMVNGYKGTKPIYGHALVTFTGNQKKCTADAKAWIKNNPVLQPAFKWEN